MKTQPRSSSLLLLLLLYVVILFDVQNVEMNVINMNRRRNNLCEKNITFSNIDVSFVRRLLFPRLIIN